MLEQSALSGFELEKARTLYLIVCSSPLLKLCLGTLCLVLMIWKKWGQTVGNFAVSKSKFSYVQAAIIAFGVLGPIYFLTLPSVLLESYLLRSAGMAQYAPLSGWALGGLVEILCCSFPIWIWYSLFRNRHRQVWIYLWVICSFSFVADGFVVTSIFEAGTRASSFRTEAPQVAERLQRMVPDFDIDRVRILPGVFNEPIGLTLGLGQNTKIYVDRTSMQSLSIDDLTFGLLHEIAHIKAHHAEIMTAFVSALGFVTLALFYRLCKSIRHQLDRWDVFDGDWNALPFLILVVLWATAIDGVAANALSRHQERVADLCALAVMHRTVPDANKIAVHFLKSLDARSPEYPAINPVAKVLFYDHPLTPERIDYLRAAKR